MNPHSRFRRTAAVPGTRSIAEGLAGDSLSAANGVARRVAAAKKRTVEDARAAGAADLLAKRGRRPKD